MTVGGGNDIVNLAQFGNANDDLTFEIPAFANAVDSGIKVLRGNQTIYGNLIDVGELVGGKRTNTFKFIDGWNQDLTRLEGSQDANHRGVLDFTGLAQNLTTTLNADGTLSVIESGNNHSATAAHIREIKPAAGKTTSLNLSAVSADLTIKVEKINGGSNATDGSNTKVTISAAADNVNNHAAIFANRHQSGERIGIGPGSQHDRVCRWRARSALSRREAKPRPSLLTTRTLAALPR